MSKIDETGRFLRRGFGQHRVFGWTLVILAVLVIFTILGSLDWFFGAW